MTEQEFMQRLILELGLPADADRERVVLEVRYWSRLIHKLSMPSLMAQAPDKYHLDDTHVQEM
jgi:hypothetical protein